MYSTGTEQAERQTDALKSWNSVYRFYARFSQCDDGGIAEGTSDAVAKLLANHWDTVTELVKLISSHKGFENFVLRHVDETIDWKRMFRRLGKMQRHAARLTPHRSARRS